MPEQTLPLIHIRQITFADLEPCARIMSDNPLWQRYGVNYDSAFKRFKTGIDNQSQIAVAVENQSITGFIWYADRGAFLRSGYISLLAVAHNRQGLGTGAALLHYAEEQLFRLSQDIFLLCSDFNRRAQQFYLREGYCQVGKIEGYILPGISELIYYKKKAK
ncbi:MAG TPA: GNAT family N-acetyltransferase [Anaerolineaceae bacterium]